MLRILTSQFESSAIDIKKNRETYNQTVNRINALAALIDYIVMNQEEP